MKNSWTYYLILRIERIPKEHKPNSYWLKGRIKRKDINIILYDYHKHPVLSNLHWHGGITWYSKEGGFDGEGKTIKVGCDYQHYMDLGIDYNLDIIKSDVKKTIETFLEHVPNYKYRCYGNGQLYNSDEGLVMDGRFYSEEFWGDNDWFKDMIDDNGL